MSLLDRSHLAFISIVITAFFIVLRKRRNRVRAPYPPGPRPYPVIGNIFPLVQPWLTYTQWQKQYGDIVYGYALGQHVVVLNSLKAVTDLFEKRGHIYSDRPLLPTKHVLGWDFILGLMHSDDTWKNDRRTLYRKYRPDAALAYRPVQIKKVHELLRNLLLDPTNFIDHYKFMADSIMMATTYGYEIAPKDDPFLANGHNAITLMTNLVFPGASVVNTLPFLRYFPSFVPGSQFHKTAEKCRASTKEMLDLPYDYVKQKLAAGTATPCLVSELLEEHEGKGVSTAEETIKALGATAFIGGVDPVASTIGTFFLAAATHPEARRKAQAEIDMVVGRERLPDFGDRPNLPYVEAFLREMMRWRPAFPMGVSHATMADDVYEGYLIPKGATVMTNIWAITRDESKYQEPNRFLPDRFFTPDGQLNDDNTILTYGFGRRVCIGRYAADATVWATIVSVLSVFDFDFAKDANGDAIPIEGNYTDAMISHIVPFKCSIVPRDGARKLIEETLQFKHL